MTGTVNLANRDVANVQGKAAALFQSLVPIGTLAGPSSATFYESIAHATQTSPHAAAGMVQNAICASLGSRVNFYVPGEQQTLWTNSICHTLRVTICSESAISRTLTHRCPNLCALSSARFTRLLAVLTLPGKLQMLNAWGYKHFHPLWQWGCWAFGIIMNQWHGNMLMQLNSCHNFSNEGCHLSRLPDQIKLTSLTFHDCRVIRRDVSLLRQWDRSVPFQKYGHYELPDQNPYKVWRRFKREEVVVLQAQMSLCRQWVGPS